MTHPDTKFSAARRFITLEGQGGEAANADNKQTAVAASKQVVFTRVCL